MAGSRALVTGGAGFIGSNLADRLALEGVAVTVLDDLSRRGTELNLEWLERRHDPEALTVVRGDVRDATLVDSLVARADVVFHLAGQTGVTTAREAPRHDFEVNAAGTLNVLEAARAQGARAPVVVYASTNKVYGGLENQIVVEEATRHVLPSLPLGLPETAPLCFGSPYACSKGAADLYVLAYDGMYGVPTVVLRQSCIYGPRQMGMEDQGWVAWFAIAGELGIPVTVFGDGKQVRDLLYIDDLVEAYLASVLTIETTRGKAYNIGGGPAFALSVWHEFSELLEDAGLTVPAAGFAPARPGDQLVFVSDTARALEDMGWAPRVPPREGLERMAGWIREVASSWRPLPTART